MGRNRCFLNRTDLTAKDEIILIIIGSLVIPAMIALCKILIISPFKKYILRPLNERKQKIREEKERDNRIRNGDLLYKDIEYLKNKPILDDYEKKALDKLEREMQKLYADRNEMLDLVTKSVEDLD